MGFFSIVPRDSKYLNYSVGSIPLRVIRDDGIEYSPNVDITTTNLNKGYINFLNNSHDGGTFKLKVHLNKNDVVESSNGSVKVMTVLDWIIRNMIPIMVYTDAVDIPSNSLYIIKDNSSRKQEYKGTTEWDLEFSTYNPLNLYQYKNDNSAVRKAIKKNKKAKSKTAYKQKLKKCNRKELKYRKKKKVVKCVKYLQKILEMNKCLKASKIDGWYGKSTVKSVKAYQKKYKKKYKLKVTGKVDKATFKALCK